MPEPIPVCVGIHLRGTRIYYAYGGKLSEIFQVSSIHAKSEAELFLPWTSPEHVRGMYSNLCQYIGKNGGSVRSLVLVVPDFYGVREFALIWRAVRQADIPLLRIIRESTAAAYAYMKQYPKAEGGLFVLCAGSSARSAAGFELGDDVVESLALFGSVPAMRGETQENEASLELALRGEIQYITPKDWDHYSRILLVGDRDVLARYERLLRLQFAEKEASSSPQDPKPDEKAFFQLDESFLSSGALAYALSIEDWSSDQNGILLLDSQPSALYLCHQGEVFQVMQTDITLPTKRSISLSEYTDPAWYEGEWIVHECSWDRRPRECGRFTVSKPYGSSDSGGQFTLDIDFRNGNIPALELRWGDQMQRWTFHEDLRIAPGWEEDALKQPQKTVRAEAAERPVQTDSTDCTEEYLLELLPVVDSLEYGVKFIQPGDDSPHAQGLVSILRQAKELLNKLEVEEIKAQGMPFDARLHNAVAQIPDLSLPPDTVREVVQTGYLYKGKVLRHASVIVSG